jgi:cytochrome c oxidase cbb3-type subunit III
MKYVALFAFFAGLALALTARAQDANPGGPDRFALPPVSLVPIAPGGGTPVHGKSKIGEEYEKSPEHIQAGKLLFSAMNCSGCHSSGGGGMGLNLMLPTKVYGSSIENIASTIVEGRPNGMPTFRGLIPMEQIWELAAYVKSLSVNPTEK